jgi:hypothetical protein
VSAAFPHRIASFATALPIRLRIIAAAVIGAVAGADHRTYLVEDMQKADDDVSLTFDGGQLVRVSIRKRAGTEILCAIC